MSKLAKVLVIIGGINWGLVGVGMFAGSNWNVVEMIFGNGKLAAIIYILVGLAALMKIFGCKCAKCKACAAGANMNSGAQKTM